MSKPGIVVAICLVVMGAFIGDTHSSMGENDNLSENVLSIQFPEQGAKVHGSAFPVRALLNTDKLELDIKRRVTKCQQSHLETEQVDHQCASLSEPSVQAGQPKVQLYVMAELNVQGAGKPVWSQKCRLDPKEDLASSASNQTDSLRELDLVIDFKSNVFEFKQGVLQAFVCMGTSCTDRLTVSDKIEVSIQTTESIPLIPSFAADATNFERLDAAQISSLVQLHEACKSTLQASPLALLESPNVVEVVISFNEQCKTLSCAIDQKLSLQGWSRFMGKYDNSRIQNVVVKWKFEVSTSFLSSIFCSSVFSLGISEPQIDSEFAEQCPKYTQITSALEPWVSDGVTVTSLQLQDIWAEQWSGLFSVLQDGTIFVLDPKAHVDSSLKQFGGHRFMQDIGFTLGELASQVSIGPIQFLAGGEVPERLHGNSVPMMAMTASDAHSDVQYPDSFFRFFHGNQSDSHPFYSAPKITKSLMPWNKRSGKVYWRGTVSAWRNNARGKLVRMGNLYPDLIDAKPQRLVNEAATDRIPAHLGGWTDFSENLLRGSRGDPLEITRFKYLINTHGNGNDWSNRFRALLSVGSLVFKQESSLFEFWERDLKPWVHYVPVKRNLADLPDKIRWAQANDVEAEAIAKRGQKFVESSLTWHNVLCYWNQLLSEAAAVLPDPATDSRFVQKDSATSNDNMLSNMHIFLPWNRRR